MTKRTFGVAGRIAVVVAVAILVSVSAFAERNGNYVTGTVQSLNRDLNYFTITDESGRALKIDVRRMDTDRSINVWRLHPGDRVAVNGEWGNNNAFRAETVNYGRASSRNGDDRNVLYGTIDSFNRRLNYFTIRDEDGRRVKIDVRRMDTRRSADVWDLREGEQIEVSGSWENNDTFEANRVNVARIRPMNRGHRGDDNRGATALTGIVQSFNRDLNYFTVRDDQTGATIKIDVRRMDTDRSVNVWRLRAGDRISVDGEWENRDTFRADTVNR